MVRHLVALVPAAGRGERLGYAIPKALVPIHSVPLVVHAIRGLQAADRVRHFVVAAPASDVDTVAAVLTDAGLDALVVPGGSTRTDSVRLALKAALAQFRDTRLVLVHDAARAFTPVEVIHAVVAELARGAPAVVPVLPVADTVKRVNAAGLVVQTPSRSDLRVVQTPQGFEVDTLRRAHEAAGNAEDVAAATDDAGLVERLGVPVSTVAGHPHAMKITTPFDLAVAEAVLAAT